MSTKPTISHLPQLDLAGGIKVEPVIKIFVAGLCIWFALDFVYNVFLHPLSRVPGPFIARFSRFWVFYKIAKRDFHEVNLELHRRYGPVVRVAPNEVSVWSAEAVKVVHGQATEFAKADSYKVHKVLEDPNALQILVEVDDKKRRFQRRLFGPAYTTAAVTQHEENLDPLLAVLVDSLKKDPEKVHDLETLFHSYSCDALGDMLLSTRPHYVEEGHDHGSAFHDWRKWRVRTVVGQSKIASSIFRFLRMYTSFGNFILGDHFTTWLMSSVKKRAADTEQEKSEKGAPKSDIAADLVVLQKKKTGWLPQWTSEMLLISGAAGNSTIVSTSLSFFANLSTRPDVQARIVEELEAAQLSSPPTYSEIAALPYLEACVKEAMRLYPALFVPLPRKAPTGGATIDGYRIPAGTTVDTNPYVVHRNKDIFGEDADVYNPDRWLGEDDEQRRLMQQNLLIWGGRSRICPGQSLGQLLIFKMYAVLLTNFDIHTEWDRSKPIIGSLVTFLPGLTATFHPKSNTH